MMAFEAADYMNRRNIFSTAAAWIAAFFGYRASDAASLEAQYQKAMRFIEGEQWDAEIRQIRESHGRPVLVFNRVLCIFQRKAYDAKLVRGSQAWKELAVDVYRKMADAQRLYNYWRNAESELLLSSGVETLAARRISLQINLLARELYI